MHLCALSRKLIKDSSLFLVHMLALTRRFFARIRASVIVVQMHHRWHFELFFLSYLAHQQKTSISGTAPTTGASGVKSWSSVTSGTGQDQGMVLLILIFQHALSSVSVSVILSIFPFLCRKFSFCWAGFALLSRGIPQIICWRWQVRGEKQRQRSRDSGQPVRTRPKSKATK